MEFINLFIALSQQKVRYLVCGGLAINIYGIPRSTADIDLILDLTTDNVRKFLEVVNKHGYIPHLPLSLEDLILKVNRDNLIKTKNLIAYSFYNSANNVMSMDVLIDSPIDFDTLWQDREERTIKNEKVFIVCIRHLIEMKKYAGRLQDEKDIILLSEFLKRK